MEQTNQILKLDCTGVRVEVWEKDCIGQIDLYISDAGVGVRGAFLSSEEADRVAVALIQATPQKTRPLPPPESWSDLDANAALELGLALIRSAK